MMLETLAKHSPPWLRLGKLGLLNPLLVLRLFLNSDFLCNEFLWADNQVILLTANLSQSWYYLVELRTKKCSSKMTKKKSHTVH